MKTFMNEMYLINGFDRASSGFSSDPPTWSNQAGGRHTVIIEKMPSSWKDFKNYLKYKRKKMSIEDLIIRLCIDEEIRGFEKKRAHNPNEAKANFVEHGQSSKFKKANNKENDTKLGPKREVSKKMKFQGKCFNYGKLISAQKVLF